MVLSTNDFFGLVENSYESIFNNSSVMDPAINDIIFLNIIYDISDINSLHKYISNVDINNTCNNTIERILEKFIKCYTKIVYDNLDLFIDIIILYFNKLLSYDIDYDTIYKNLKIELKQLKKKKNHQIIYNIKKSIIKY